MTLTMPTSRVRRLAALAMLFCLAGPALNSQAAGPGIAGRVFALDDKGLPAGLVPGAKIEIKGSTGQAAAQATADARGFYKIDLSPGTYTYKVHAAGFKDEDVGRGITLKLSEGYAVYNFSLVKGETSPDRKPPVIPVVESGRLKGRVLEKVREGGFLGIPGARIFLKNTKGPAPLIEILSSTKSGDAAGRYEVILPAGTYRASVIAVGFETLVDAVPIEIVADKTETRDFVLKRLVPPIARDQGIKGTIRAVDVRGRVVALPEVTLTIRPRPVSLPSAISFNPDAQGNYSRELVTGGYEVVARAKGYRTVSSGPRYVFPGKYTIVNLTLRPLKPVLDLAFVASVFERNPDSMAKQPLQGATVLLRKQGQRIDGALRGMTGTEGTVSLKPTSSGDYTVLAYKTGYKPAGQKMSIVQGAANRAEIILEKETTTVLTATLTAEVFERAPVGKIVPVSGARIVVRKAGQSVGQGITDTSGRYSAVLARASYSVEASKSEYLSATATADVTQGNASIRLYLSPIRKQQGTLTLKVMELEPDGKTLPVSNAQVMIRREGQPVVQGVSDTAGFFSAKLAGDTHEVVVNKTGYQAARIQVLVSDRDMSRTILLKRGVIRTEKTLTLTVREWRGEMTPLLSGARVTVNRVGGNRVASGVTDSGGTFATRLPHGIYSVEVGKDQYRSVELPVTIDDHDVSRTVTLRKAMIVTARNLSLMVREKRDEMTRPLAGANVVITRMTGSGGTSGDTDTMGRYSTRLAVGGYTVAVSKTGYRTSSIQVTLSDQDVQRTVILDAIAKPAAKPTLHLQVMQRMGMMSKPIPGAEVTIVQNRMQRSSGRSDERGSMIAKLPAGSYNVQVVCKGFQPAQVEVTLTDQDVNRTIFLTKIMDTPKPEEKGPVNLHVVQRDRKMMNRLVNVSDARVLITQDQRTVAQGTSGPDGYYRVTLPQGNYRITVSKAGFMTAQMSLAVTKQGVTEDVILRSSIK